MRARRLVGAFIPLSIPCLLGAQLPAYNVPDDPAFTFLDAAPKKVANPGTLPALGLALANGIDNDGRVNAGLAVSFLPSSLIRFSPSPDSYRNGYPSFWLYNTQLSVATVRASGDTGSTDLGFGLRTIFRGPEPYADPQFREDLEAVLGRCLVEAGQADSSTLVLEQRAGVRAVAVRDPNDPEKILRPTPGVPLSADTLELTYLDARGKPIRTEKVVVRRIRNGSVITQDTVRAWKAAPNTVNSEVALDCGNRGKSRTLRRWMDAHWNDATLALSLASGTRFAESSVSHTHSLGAGAWIVGGLPIRWRTGLDADARVHNIGQLSAQLHYSSASRSTRPASRSTDWGVRAVAGSARSNGFAELTRGLTGGRRKEARAWSTGVEYMAAESVWLSVGVGERFSEATSSARTFVFTNLKWGLSRDPQLAAR